MAEPPLLTGAVQLNATCVKFEFASSLKKTVGGSGTVAAMIGNTEVSMLLPTIFFALSLKLYVVPAVNPVTIKEREVYDASLIT